MPGNNPAKSTPENTIIQETHYRVSVFQLIARHKLAIVILIAILVRLAFLAIFPSIFMFERTESIHGSQAYDIYAQNLRATGVYGRVPGVADSIIPPLYSYVLAGVYSIFGRGGWQVGIFHTLLDVLSIVMLSEIGKRLFKNTTPTGNFTPENPEVSQRNGQSEKPDTATDAENAAPGTHHRERSAWVGALAGLFYAVYPYLVFQNLTLNDTALYMLLLHAFVLIMILLRDQPGLNRQTWLIATLGGIILGITTLSRALLPPLAILVAIWFLFRLNLRQTLLRLLPVAVVSLLILLPWVIRGYQLYDGFVAVALNSGENVFQGANDMTIPLFRAGYDVQWSKAPAGGETITDPYERNTFLMQTGLTWLREHPGKIPELVWTKFLVYWSIDVAPRNNPLADENFDLDENGNLLVLKNTGATPIQDGGTIAAYSGGLFDQVGRPVHIVYFGVLLLLALAGMWLSRHLWRDVALLWFVQLSMTLIYLVFHPSTRYRAPTDPMLFLFSAYTLVVIAGYSLARGKPSQ